MSPHRDAEGCRRLDSVAGLKPGERHCPYCAGYGGRPVAPDFRGFTNHTQPNPPRCGYCDGSGKAKP